MARQSSTAVIAGRRSQEPGAVGGKSHRRRRLQTPSTAGTTEPRCMVNGGAQWTGGTWDAGCSWHRDSLSRRPLPVDLPCVGGKTLPFGIEPRPAQFFRHSDIS
jgi:hypothetical protein